MLFFVNQSGKVQTNLRAITERANGFYREGVSGELDWWDFKTNNWSWFSWLTPFLGPIVAFLLLLIFGPCIFNLLVKFVSSRIQQINLQMVMQQQYQPDNTCTTLEQAAITFHGAHTPPYIHPDRDQATRTQGPTRPWLSRKQPERVRCPFFSQRGSRMPERELGS